MILRKEAIRRRFPYRLTRNDLVPMAKFIFGASLHKVASTAADAPCFRGLTDGVVHGQGHFHRGMMARE